MKKRSRDFLIAEGKKRVFKYNKGRTIVGKVKGVDNGPVSEWTDYVGCIITASWVSAGREFQNGQMSVGFYDWLVSSYTFSDTPHGWNRENPLLYSCGISLSIWPPSIKSDLFWSYLRVPKLVLPTDVFDLVLIYFCVCVFVFALYSFFCFSPEGSTDRQGKPAEMYWKY